VIDEDAAAALAGPAVTSLEDARGVEVVTEADVAAAQAEAAQAEAEAGAAEHLAVHGRKDPADVVALRETSRFAKLRAALAARRYERSQAAGRLLSLGQIATEVDALAEGSAPYITAAAEKLTEAAAELRRVCQGHDGAVQALITRAQDLGAEPALPSGLPKASSAHVEVSPDRKQIRHGATAVRLIGDAAEAAIGKAAAGDADGAVAVIAAVHEQPEPVRAQAYYRRGDGMIFAGDSDEFEYQERHGLLARLTGQQVTAYLEGKLDGQH